MGLLTIHRLAVGYRDSHPPLLTIKDLNLSTGRVYCLLGNNGVGKSTFFKTLSGLIKPLEGQVDLDDSDLLTLGIKEKSKKLALITRDNHWPLYLTVGDYLALGRLPFTRWHGKLTVEDKKKMLFLAKELDLEHLLTKEISKVSDGEKQRAILGRGLLQEPQFLLLDEPTVYLDIYHCYKLMNMLKHFSRTRDLGVIFSSHNLEAVWQIADVLLLAGDNQILSLAIDDVHIKGALENCLGKKELKFNVVKKCFEMPRG